MPTVDISNDTERQVIVAEGTETVYQGHPHTLLMPDGKTLFCVWTLNHGRGAPRMMRSDDGGRTWIALDVPENWDRGSFPHCPTVHRVVDREGKARLLLMDGHGSFGQSISEDDGVTWSPMVANGLTGIVAPLSVLPVAGGVKHLLWTHRGAHDRDRSPLTVWQAASEDGGPTWGDFRKVVEVRGADPCEPCVIRSPNGKQLLMLMRENRRRLNSLYAVSDDEGQTWSNAMELTASLTGDRHAARYGPDGRLVVAMRDQAALSPTRGHFVAWVGRYEDILAGREGQCRVKLLHSHAGGDCGYPGLELLSGETFVATTYIKYRPGPRKHSVVSVRFKLKEIDEMAKLLPEQSVVFRSGADGYHTYRIPAMVVSTKGTVLAFCEGRKEGISDHGNIHLMLKRSFDHGQTWEPMQLVWKEEDPGKKVTMGNPCAVVDEEKGTIWLTFCRENDRVFVTRSDDDGATWSSPQEITGDVKHEDWRWYATGPGNGIQIKRGPHKGRLVIPCDHALSWPPRRGQAYYSHVFFSDDHGETWQLGGRVGDAVNECAVAERSDGSLLLNMRTWDSRRHRAIAASPDGGTTWSEAAYDEALPEPQCQGSLIRIPNPVANERALLLFSNPADTRTRIRMTVRLSCDDGRTWASSKQLHEGPSSYSSLAVAKDGTILCLYEGGIEHRREWIRLARFRLEWLAAGPEPHET